MYVVWLVGHTGGCKKKEEYTGTCGSGNSITKDVIKLRGANDEKSYLIAECI